MSSDFLIVIPIIRHEVSRCEESRLPSARNRGIKGTDWHKHLDSLNHRTAIGFR